MEEEFRAFLLATSTITSQVGDRINFGTQPQGHLFPAIVLNTVSDIDGAHMNGGGPSEGRVQVDCYAATYGAAKLVSRAVRSALHLYRGGGFLLIKQISANDSREGGTNEAERPYRSRIDFKTIWRPE